MKQCEYQGEQDKCGKYRARDKDGKRRKDGTYVRFPDFTCLYFRKDFPYDGYGLCDQEYQDKEGAK